MFSVSTNFIKEMQIATRSIHLNKKVTLLKIESLVFNIDNIGKQISDLEKLNFKWSGSDLIIPLQRFGMSAAEITEMSQTADEVTLAIDKLKKLETILRERPVRSLSLSDLETVQSSK